MKRLILFFYIMCSAQISFGQTIAKRVLCRIINSSSILLNNLESNDLIVIKKVSLQPNNHRVPIYFKTPNDLIQRIKSFSFSTCGNYINDIPVSELSTRIHYPILMNVSVNTTKISKIN